MQDINAMLATMSADERRDFLGQVREADKNARANEREAARLEREAARAEKLEALRKEREVYTPLLAPVVEEIITSTPVKESDKGWAGYTLAGVPVTIDGHEFLAKVVVTDVTMTERNKAAQA